MLNIVLFGAPGAGKGTQSDLLVERYKLNHISTGDLLRKEIADQTELGKRIKSIMDSGSLVSDDIVVEMIDNAIAKDTQGILFDGFPRNEAQAAALDKLAADAGATVDLALCIDVSKDALLARLGGRRVCPKCGAGYHVVSLPPEKEGVCDACGAALITRLDDQPATIAHRLEVYEQVTAPVVGWYEKAGKLRRVDGSGSAAEVAALVEDAVR